MKKFQIKYVYIILLLIVISAIFYFSVSQTAFLPTKIGMDESMELIFTGNSKFFDFTIVTIPADLKNDIGCGTCIANYDILKSGIAIYKTPQTPICPWNTVPTAAFTSRDNIFYKGIQFRLLGFTDVRDSSCREALNYINLHNGFTITTINISKENDIIEYTINSSIPFKILGELKVNACIDSAIGNLCNEINQSSIIINEGTNKISILILNNTINTEITPFLKLYIPTDEMENLIIVDYSAGFKKQYSANSISKINFGQLVLDSYLIKAKTQEIISSNVNESISSIPNTSVVTSVTTEWATWQTNEDEVIVIRDTKIQNILITSIVILIIIITFLLLTTYGKK